MRIITHASNPWTIIFHHRHHLLIAILFFFLTNMAEVPTSLTPDVCHKIALLYAGISAQDSKNLSNEDLQSQLAQVCTFCKVQLLRVLTIASLILYWGLSIRATRLLSSGELEEILFMPTAYLQGSVLLAHC